MRRLFRRSAGSGPLVLDVQSPRVRVEGADRLASVGAGDCVAVIAHWAPDARVSRSVVELTRSLISHGYQVALMSSAEGLGPLEWPGDEPASLTLLRRPKCFC